MFGSCNKCGNDVATASNASATSPLNGTTDDNGETAGSESHNQTSYLKDGNAGYEDDLEREVLVSFPPGGLESGESHEKGRSVPADLVDAVKLGCNGGNHRGYNCL